MDSAVKTLSALKCLILFFVVLISCTTSGQVFTLSELCPVFPRGGHGLDLDLEKNVSRLLSVTVTYVFGVQIVRIEHPDVGRKCRRDCSMRIDSAQTLRQQLAPMPCPALPCIPMTVI